MKEVRTGTQFKQGRNLETGTDNWLGTYGLINLLSYTIQFLHLRYGTLPDKSQMKKMPNDLPTTQSHEGPFALLF